MEFQSKIDQNNGDDYTNSTIFAGIRLQKNNTTPKANDNGSSKFKKDRSRLNNKVDVLNSEHLLHHIESEFLSYEKINFKLKWSTYHHDMKMKIFKNIFKVDHIHGNHNEHVTQFLNNEFVNKAWADINEVKRLVDLFNTNVKNKKVTNTEQSQHDISQASIPMTIPYTPLNRVESNGADITKFIDIGSMNSMNAKENDFVVENIGMPGSDAFSVQDLVITPNQPPIHPLNDKYRMKKVYMILKENLEFEVTIYFPKKFEALRRFYCGSHEDFIKSIMKTKDWADNSGGKQRGKFFKSGDEKYIFKEIKNGEMRMFTDFAPRYFDYLCKSFFHNFP